MRDIIINGKFLSGKLNGVHRVAECLSASLLKHAAEEDRKVQIVAPSKIDATHASAQLQPVILGGLFDQGQLWENITLPVYSRNKLLINFCNLAPIIHPQFVVMIHDVQTYLYPDDYSRRMALGYRLMLPLIGQRAKRVLTVSYFAKKLLVEHGVAPENKIRVVYNGADHILKIPPDMSILQRLRLRKDQFYLSIGSRQSYKNIAKLFEVMSSPLMKARTLVIAGGPPAEEYVSQGLQPPSNVIFTGFISDPELRALYENATAFLWPSRTEGFGLPPVEAMHCGCPVISSLAGAMPEILGEAAEFVDPEDTQLWLEAIERLDDLDYRSSRILEGRRRAQLYLWEKSGEQLWDAIHELL